MISSQFIRDKLKDYSNLTGYNVRSGMPDALAYKLSKADYKEYQISKAIDRLIDNGERVGYSEIVRNIPRQKEDDWMPECTWAQFEKNRDKTKNKCVNDYNCGSCPIDVGCSILGDVVPGVVQSLISKEITKDQAKEILSKFKGLEWFKERSEP